MKKLYKGRLLKLARHIVSKKREHSKFDFDHISTRHACGTIGCAMGELPACFPRSWRFGTWGADDTRTIKRRVKGNDIERSVSTFFGLNENEMYTLFFPSYRNELGACGLRRLSAKTTVKRVANNIEKFVRLKSK